MRIAVVIPAIDEAEGLPATLAGLAEAAGELDVVVVDGGSMDRTVEVASAAGAQVVEAAPGRAVQMNAGAAVSKGEALLFLHADTVIGPVHLAAIETTLGRAGVVGGSFPIRFPDPTVGLRLIAAGANLRTRLDGTPYGDQALFVQRAEFEAIGGYPEVPILEELILGRRLRRRGRLVFPAGPAVVTSARRWRRQGMVRTTLRNALTRVLWELGVSPQRLSRLRRGPASRL